MQTLRRAHTLARHVLVWFALSLGVAIASPVVNPQDMQMVCTGSGVMKVIDTTTDGTQETGSLSMGCPLCAGVSTPPAVFVFSLPVLLPLSLAVTSTTVVITPKLSAAPLPARGPPNSI